RDAKVEFTVAPVPRLFKQPVVWTMPHQFTFPKPKSVDRAKRDAAWTHIRWITDAVAEWTLKAGQHVATRDAAGRHIRWMADHVAEWTLKAGQVSATRKSHTDPRITGDPVLRTLLAQAPNWQAGAATPAQGGRGDTTSP